MYASYLHHLHHHLLAQSRVPKEGSLPLHLLQAEFHHTRIGRDGLCERCFSSICAQSDSFALRGRCIDALDDGTVDPDDL